MSVESSSLSTVSETVALPPAFAGAMERESLWAAHMELGKVRLSAMVVFTTALGYVVASRQNFTESFDWMRLFWTCAGTFLAAVGASAFNQAIEAPRDARMKRTQQRPLVTGRLSRTYAATFGLIVSIIGVAIICPTSNGLTAILATANVIIYAFIYTPLKTVSSINTLVGAIVGGIPPIMGWTAATDSLSAGAWVLGGILFVWQIPHFLALSWMYREDYARGGFKMLPAIDGGGRLTGMLAVMYSLLLMPLWLMMVRLGHAGWIFATIALVMTAWMTLIAMRFARGRTHADARRLFLASIVYLPVLTIALMIAARGPYDDFQHGDNGYVFPASEADQQPLDPIPGSPAADSQTPDVSPHNRP